MPTFTTHPLISLVKLLICHKHFLFHLVFTGLTVPWNSFSKLNVENMSWENAFLKEDCGGKKKQTKKNPHTHSMSVCFTAFQNLYISLYILVVGPGKVDQWAKIKSFDFWVHLSCIGLYLVVALLMKLAMEWCIALEWAMRYMQIAIFQWYLLTDPPDQNLQQGYIEVIWLGW